MADKRAIIIAASRGLGPRHGSADTMTPDELAELMLTNAIGAQPPSRLGQDRDRWARRQVEIADSVRGLADVVVADTGGGQHNLDYRRKVLPW